MRALVDDLLDVSRVTRGLITLEREELDINAIVTNAVEQVRSLIDAGHHRLTLQLSGESAHVMGDRTRMVQVFSNILNNAAKYTPPRGEINIGVHVDDDQVEVSVRDNGMGIAPEVLPYIFDLFTQADRTLARSLGGLGIGLALVKSLVGLHGGSVAARSDGHNQGSEFSVRLPRIRAAEPAVPSRRGDRRAGSLRILVVDDNVDAAQSLSLLLNIDGHQVAVDHDGRSALTRLHHERWDVLLLDIGLPDMSGYEVARRIRALPGMANVALVALTGYGQSQDVRQSKEAGFDHHLVKPASMEQLTRVLSQVRAIEAAR